MTALKGIIQNGQVVLPTPPNLPDETEVAVLPLRQAESDVDPLGPEEIARLLAQMDQVQPFELTAEERAALEADRRCRKEWEKAHFDERAAKPRSSWQ
jgi:hypothetical protein